MDATCDDRLRTLTVGAKTYRYLPMADRVADDVWAELPYTVRILLENIARTAPERFEAVLLRAASLRG